MIPDYLAFVAADDFDLSGPFDELVNSVRAYRYAFYARIPWLQDCRACTWAYPSTEPADYYDPSAEPWAPWYHPSIAHSGEFLGLIGLDVSGGDDSTRRANVSTALTGGGHVSAPYYHPRTIVVRALAIATSDPGLAVGLEWAQFTEPDEGDPCAPPTLMFYDSCFPEGDNDAPYRRGFREARITEGPTVLGVKWRNHLNADIGCFAELEYTFVAGDPVKYHPGLSLAEV